MKLPIYLWIAFGIVCVQIVIVMYEIRMKVEPAAIEPPRIWTCIEAVSCPHVDWRFNRMEDVCVYDDVIRVSPSQPDEHCHEITESGKTFL